MQSRSIDTSYVPGDAFKFCEKRMGWCWLLLGVYLHNLLESVQVPSRRRRELAAICANLKRHLLSTVNQNRK